MKGTYAAAVGAVLAGCRHVFGYPITPSTEGAELMAKVLPEIDGIFVQAVSEVATVNMMYGAGGAGKRCMTFTSSPGFSLMLEGISYMVGAEVPAVFVNIMRGGPGLGNVGPEQADIKLGVPGPGPRQHPRHRADPGHPPGDARPHDAFVRARLQVPQPGGRPRRRLSRPDDGEGPATASDGRPGIPEWAVYGDRSHRGNLICSIRLKPKSSSSTTPSTTSTRGSQMRSNVPTSRRRRCPDLPRSLQHTFATGQGGHKGAARKKA